LQVQDTVNLFATWKGRAALDGLVVELPAGWTLQEARALRYGYEPIPVKKRSRDSGTSSRYVLRLNETLRDPFDLVVRIRTGSSPGSHRWSVTPFTWQTSDRQTRVPQTTYRLDQRLRTSNRAATTPTGHALSFSGGAPVTLQVRDLLALSKAPYTVAFWMRTHTLGAVVLSTWSGEERQPYPLEGVIDANGRLSVYRGRQGLHESVSTSRPVADGQWHHVAVTHGERRVMLYLDGTAVDSLQTNALPSRSETPLVLGGRPGDGSLSDETTPAPYSGLLDDVLVQPGAMAAPALRALLRKPPAASSENALFLAFEEGETTSSITGTTLEAERVPIHREARPPVTRLRARAQDRQVELTWRARRASEATFYVERSTDGRDFETVGQLAPNEATPSPSSDNGALRFRFSDAQAPDRGVLYYRVRRVAGDEKHVSRTLKVGRGATQDERPMLLGNSPNPFSSSTTISYRVYQRQHVQLSVWDLSGHQVAKLVDAVRPEGSHKVTFTPRQLPSGTYFARIQTPTRTESLKMTVVQ